MIERNEIESVWFIENNELKNANRVVTKLDYKGQEITILKSEREWIYTDLLIKDNNQVYWNLGIAPAKFQNFIDVLNNQADTKTIEYCNDISKAYKNLDLECFFAKKINEKRYFNKCELKYISIHIPDLYDKAKKSRENFLTEREKAIELQKRAKAEQEQVDITNEIFEKRLNEIKQNINLDKEIQVEDLVFYKDKKYENGKTTQNCILYLAKQYGINIPLATQGFINNRLVSYDFGNGTFAYKITDKNKKASNVMHKYLIEISKCVKSEFKDNIKELKTKLKEMNGGVK